MKIVNVYGQMGYFSSYKSSKMKARVSGLFDLPSFEIRHFYC